MSGELAKTDQINQKPWNRLPNETPKGFMRFVVYRDMGLNRSLAKAKRRWLRIRKGRDEKPLSLGSWKHFSGRWHWVERAHAWDLAQAEHNLELAAIRTIEALAKRAKQLARCADTAATDPLTSDDYIAASEALYARLPPEQSARFVKRNQTQAVVIDAEAVPLLPPPEGMQDGAGI